MRSATCLLKTSGVNEADSTSLILSLYCLFCLFMPSIDCRDAGVAVALCVWVKNPYVKECTLLSSPETPCSDVSSGIIPPVCCLWYDVSGCSGSCLSTSWHTLLSQLAVMSRISLCLMMVRLPCLQIIAWSVENGVPQTQCVGKFLSCQPQ